MVQHLTDEQILQDCIHESNAVAGKPAALCLLKLVE